MDSTGIVGAIRQMLKDKELQQWMSEMNNNIKRDADQNSKMRTYSTEKFLIQNNRKLQMVINTCHRITKTKMAIKQPQTHHRNRPILKTFNLRPYKKPEERVSPICKLEDV